jgi:hypothetical protein
MGDQGKTQQVSGTLMSRVVALLKELWIPLAMAWIGMKLMGAVGALTACAAFMLLRPRLGTPGAVAAGVAIGVAVWFTASSLLLR